MSDVIASLTNPVAPWLILVLLAASAQAQGVGPCKAGFRVALDVGHTLARPGATSATGVNEFDYNRRLALEVDRRLQVAGVDHVVIGASGAPIGLAERTEAARRAGATAFLSLHHDSVQPHFLAYWAPGGRRLAYSDQFAGYSLFVSGEGPRREASLRMATALGDTMLGAGLRPSLHHAADIPGERRPLLDVARGIYRFDALAVLRTAAMPAVLLEAGIIVNRREEELIRSAEGLDRTSGAITRGLLRFCAAG